jgi:hypothetical protein
VSDPSPDCDWRGVLAYGHPLWMIASLALTVVAARSGLRMRNARRLGVRRDPDDRGRHLRIAKLGVALVAIGWVGGPLSMALLRDRAPFDTAHAWIATTTLGLFVATAVLGRGLEQGRHRRLDAHALVAMASLLAAGVAAITGFVLLP